MVLGEHLSSVSLCFLLKILSPIYVNLELRSAGLLGDRLSVDLAKVGINVRLDVSYVLIRGWSCVKQT